MSMKRDSGAAGLREALNKLTYTVHNEWDDPSKLPLNTDERHGLIRDLAACLRHLKRLADQLEASDSN